MSIDHCCAANCCNERRTMLEGECMTFCVDFSERLASMCGAKALDSRSPAPVLTSLKHGGGVGMTVSHEVECADGKVFVKVDTMKGQSAGDYKVDVTVLTDSCERTSECFILQVKKCR